MPAKKEQADRAAAKHNGQGPGYSSNEVNPQSRGSKRVRPVTDRIPFTYRALDAMSDQRGNYSFENSRYKTILLHALCCVELQNRTVTSLVTG